MLWKRLQTLLPYPPVLRWQTLITLQETFGIDDNYFLKVALSKQDVASYAGTTYEIVFKIFCRMDRSRHYSHRR
ncbi:hypothetical protein [Mucilaginibacter limnophilus]|uniref:hypothetical protein n=1 Tax=Mucilaginibacter limnophilus TaxID=1932778 RepID=UPI0013E3982F|nr:hypothetical protein [Mucilaginibacter limnophilus]